MVRSARRDFRLQMLPESLLPARPGGAQTLTQTIERQLTPYLAHRTRFPTIVAGTPATAVADAATRAPGGGAGVVSVHRESRHERYDVVVVGSGWGA